MSALDTTNVTGSIGAAEWSQSPGRPFQISETHRHANANRESGYFVPSVLSTRPAAIDLRQQGVGFPPIYNQGALNSCTAQVLAALLYHDMCPAEAFEPSRLFIYYNERNLRRQVGHARYGRRGAPVRMDDCIKSIQATGFCREAQWPYVETLSDARPAASLYESAAQHRPRAFQRVAGDVAHLKACLAQGRPFGCGIVIYERFLGPGVCQRGIVSLPAPDEAMRGGHAVAIVGYDDARSHFIARNSFGPEWGDAGHCYLPYAFLGDPCCAFDFWTVGAAGDGELGGIQGTGGRHG